MFFSISVPSGPPEDVRCQGRGFNSIHIEWSKPMRENRNGIIRGYNIQYYPRTLWYGKKHYPYYMRAANKILFPGSFLNNKSGVFFARFTLVCISRNMEERSGYDGSPNYG